MSSVVDGCVEREREAGGRIVFQFKFSWVDIKSFIRISILAWRASLLWRFVLEEDGEREARVSKEVCPKFPRSKRKSAKHESRDFR